MPDAREIIAGAAEFTPPPVAAPGLSDDALAQRFTTKHRDDLRYVAGWGRWLQWDGRRWSFDKTLLVFDLARLVCRSASAEAEPDDQEAVASARTIAAVEKLARSDRQHASLTEDWDRDPWLLNTSGGTVELRTGKLRPHRREDLLTKITAATPAGDCPIWRAFLARVTDGDIELQRFLQRVAGYALTGVTSDHALFFAHGSGGNGKGVFVNALTRILGDYSAVAAMETFIATNGDRHSTDLAMLRGARLVSAQETEEGRSWAESKIKALTGGDPITARFMRQDNFTFQPQFKLVIAGNHKPSLQNVDEAIRRRFHLLPFTVTIPEEERDPGLPDKLAAEAGGILSWAIEGCLDWQKNGLHPPEVVRQATARYLEEEDSFGSWLDECCIRDRREWESAGDLYESWKVWAKKAGEREWKEKRFGQTLQKRGFEAQKSQGVRGYVGIALTRRNYTDDPRYP